MADVFVSYARADQARVAPLVAAIAAKGWSVWWDPETTPGQEFDDQIDAEIDAAKAVMVVWTPTSVVSRWVRGEAREATDRFLPYAKADPDLELLRDEPRFQAMIADAEARLARDAEPPAADSA